MLRLADICTAWYILSMRSLERVFSGPVIGKIRDAKQTSAKLKGIKLAHGEASKDAKSHPTEENASHSSATNPWINKEKPEDPNAWMMAPLQELSNCSISRMSHHRLAAYVQSLPPSKVTDKEGTQVTEFSLESDSNSEHHSTQEASEKV